LKAWTQYLSKYAHPLVSEEFLKTAGVWDKVVVVPLRREGRAFAPLLPSLKAAAENANIRCLAIFLVNGREGDSKEIDSSNAESVQCLKESERAYPKAGALNLLTLDFTNPSRLFQKKEGVGTARKIGCDVALSLIDTGRVQSPWIYCTDADATVPSDYFSSELPCMGAVVFPFHHKKEDSLPLALYDIHLRYYVLGLRYAGSPYSFSAMGSAIAVHAETYAKVRGFPPRLAGEDFYLLNKAAKIGEVRELGKRGRIELSARESDRVPFGTGTAMEKISKLEGDPFLLYAPELFFHLKKWLSLANSLCHMSVLPPKDEALAGFPKELLRAFTETGAWEILEHAHKMRTSAFQRALHFHTGFDGLKTLRWIHIGRDSLFPSLPWDKALWKAGLVKTATSAVLASDELEEMVYDGDYRFNLLESSANSLSCFDHSGKNDFDLGIGPRFKPAVGIDPQPLGWEHLQEASYPSL
jgi:hypothetical protein